MPPMCEGTFIEHINHNENILRARFVIKGYRVHRQPFYHRLRESGRNSFRPRAQLRHVRLGMSPSICSIRIFNPTIGILPGCSR